MCSKLIMKNDFHKNFLLHFYINFILIFIKIIYNFMLSVGNKMQSITSKWTGKNCIIALKTYNDIYLLF